MVRNQWKEHLWKHLDQHQKCSSARCKKATAVLTWHLLSLGHCLHLVLHECRTSCDLARPMAWWFFLVSKANHLKQFRAPRWLRDQLWWLRSKFSVESTQGICQRIRFTIGTETIIRRFQEIQWGLHLETWAWWMCSKDLNLPFENIANSYINKSWFTHGLQRLQGITQPNKEQVQRDMTEEAAQKRTERRVFFSMWTWWKSPMLGGCHLKMLCGFGAALVFNKNHVDKYF